jgi:hypothetical protein
MPLRRWEVTVNLRLVSALASALLAIPGLAAAQTVERHEVGAMLQWVNAQRAQGGVAPLTLDGRLSAVAEAHSMDMAGHGFFSHTSPQTGGPGDRIRTAGLAPQTWAENIALNQSALAAHQALVHSPGHYANIMNPALRSVGLGMVRGDSGLYVTQVFATLSGGAVAAPPAPAPVGPDAVVPSVGGLVNSALNALRNAPASLPSLPEDAPASTGCGGAAPASPAANPASLADIVSGLRRSLPRVITVVTGADAHPALGWMRRRIRRFHRVVIAPDAVLAPQDDDAP